MTISSQEAPVQRVGNHFVSRNTMNQSEPVRESQIMSQDIEYDPNGVCGLCGRCGALAICGNFICGKCIEKHARPPDPKLVALADELVGEAKGET